MTATAERGRLTQAQILALVAGIDPGHVEVKRGMSYMAQYQVRAELTRIFGYGNWDSQVEEMTLLYEKQILKGGGDPQYPTTGKAPEYWVVAYRAAVRLNIRDYWGLPICSFVEYHAEENAPQPNRGEAHALAMTSVESYALRRAAIGLGDRLGLGLYHDKGSTAPLVLRTLQLDDRESPQVFGGPAQRSLPAQVSAPSHLREVQEQMQTDREAAKQRASMTDRLQQGLKVDEAAE